MITREPIYAALFARLQAVSGFRTISRRLKHWTDVPASMQPALYLVQRHEVLSGISGQLVRYDLEADVYLYANTADQSSTPSQILNPLLDAVEATLQPDYTGKQTLGGLVQHCWIEGSIETDEGVLGDQAVAIIPIKIKFA